MKKIEIFTDGACKGNPGPGGWGAVLRTEGKEKHIYGGEANTTNNRMELMAAIEALRSLKQGSQIILTTDSKYVMQGVTQWIFNWKRNNWLTAAKKPVKNKDLWQLLDALIVEHHIEWRWVKGHSGHPDNELADELANKGVVEHL